MWEETTLSKIARTLGVALLAAAPVLAFAAPASAAAGCSVNNTSTNSQGNVSIVVTPTGSNPVTVGASSTSLACEYVTSATTATLTCATPAGGTCRTYVDGTASAFCVLVGNSSCTTVFNVQPGQTIRLEVLGGQGSVTDNL